MSGIGPWAVRFAAVLFILAIAKPVPALAAIFVAGAAIGALLILLAKGRYLPRFIMDPLDRLTNRAALESAYEARHQKLTVIDAEDLARRVKGRVIGQDRAVESIAQQLRRRFAARRPDKPIAVFCLAGPPGVGKTHLAKVLAEELFGDKTFLHFFDMSQFGQPHAAASLFGQARGYVGSQSYGALTAALRDTPLCVVLLDEFEKAHPEVHKRFLTAWNDGFVTEVSDGARVATNEVVFVLTTNAASRRIGEIARDHADDPGEVDRLTKAALGDAQFAPEVLSRIDEVFAFRPLAGLDIARVVALELEKLARQYGLEIDSGGIDPSVLLDAVQAASERYDTNVRDIARAIERQATDGMIDARGQGGRVIRIARDGSRIRIETASKQAPAGAAAVKPAT